MLHDIFLPTYPLCIEWIDFNASAPENRGHFAAMGYMTHEIDVWDLNTAGCLEPAFRLGKKMKKANRHTDAVLDLSWNTNTRYFKHSKFYCICLFNLSMFSIFCNF